MAQGDVTVVIQNRIGESGIGALTDVDLDTALEFVADVLANGYSSDGINREPNELRIVVIAEADSLSRVRRLLPGAKQRVVAFPRSL